MPEQSRREYAALYSQWEQEEWSDEDPQKFVRLARRLTELEPSNPNAWDALATSLMGLLCPPESDAQEVIESLKDSPLFWEMVLAFQREMELDPSESAAPWNRAICFERAGLHDKAYTDYLKVAEIDRRLPSHTREHSVHIELLLAGQAIFRHGDYFAAARTLKEAIEAAIEEGIDEDTVAFDQTWYYLATSLEKLDKASEALDAYQEAATLNREDYGEAYLAATKRLGGKPSTTN